MSFLQGLGRLRGLAPLGAFLLIWEVVASEESVFFPSPSSWVPALRELWQEGVLGPAAAATWRTVAISLVLSSAFGGLIGLVVGVFPSADRALGPTLEFARAMPPAAVVPVATLLIGYEDSMKVTVVTLASIWAVLLNTRAGVRRLDPVLIDVARSLNLGRIQTVRKVTLPALLPSIFIGIRVAAPIALVITLLVEIVTQVPGLGALISMSQRRFQSARVWGLVMLAGLFSLLVSGLVGAVEAHIFRNRPGHRRM